MANTGGNQSQPQVKAPAMTKVALNVRSDNEIIFTFFKGETPIDITKNYTTVELESQGVILTAINDPENGINENCYQLSNTELVVTIPTYSFARTGNLYYTAGIREKNVNFPDGYKDTWLPKVDIDIAYFKNYEEDIE